MALWALTCATAAVSEVLEALTLCWQVGMASLMTFEFDLTGNIDPGLMLEGGIGVLNVTGWVLGQEECCN